MRKYVRAERFHVPLTATQIGANSKKVSKENPKMGREWCLERWIAKATMYEPPFTPFFVARTL